MSFFFFGGGGGGLGFFCFCFLFVFFFVVIDPLTRQGDINLLMSATVFVKRITRKNQIIQGTSSLSEQVPNYVVTIHSGYKFSRVEFLYHPFIAFNIRYL